MSLDMHQSYRLGLSSNQLDWNILTSDGDIFRQLTIFISQRARIVSLFGVILPTRDSLD